MLSPVSTSKTALLVGSKGVTHCGFTPSISRIIRVTLSIPHQHLAVCRLSTKLSGYQTQSEAAGLVAAGVPCYAIYSHLTGYLMSVFIFDDSVFRGSERYISWCNPFADNPFSEMNFINVLIVSGSVAYGPMCIICTHLPFCDFFK